MKILLVPKVITRYKNQIEFLIEDNLILFLKKTFKDCLIDIAYDLIFKKETDLIILSGGNTIKKYSNKTEDIVRSKYDNFYLKQSIKYKIPLIGICHGAQFIASKNNSKFKRDKEHIGFSHGIIGLNKKLVKNFTNVVCYHNYKIISCCKQITTIAEAEDKSIEAFLLKIEKIAGIVWHPERSKRNLNDQSNFFKKVYGFISSSIR